MSEKKSSSFLNSSQHEKSSSVCFVGILIKKNSQKNGRKRKNKISFLVYKYVKAELPFVPMVYTTTFTSSTESHISSFFQFLHQILAGIMDQTWRMRFGIPRFRSRRSEDETLHPKPTTFHPDDFSDVFGGPPRTVISRQFSDSSSFYEEVFRSTEFVSRPRKAGRSLPAFRIPVKEDRFYRDVFGSDDGRRSRDRSEPSSKEFTRSNSSSDLSLLRPLVGDDVAFPSSSSNHRLVVYCRN